MVYKKLYLRTADDYIFDIDLRGRIVVVDGLSGSGKTFLFNTVMTNKLNPVSVNTAEDTDLSNVVTINIFNKEMLNTLSSIRGKLIIIDNADVLLTQKEADYISSDMNNQYLIYSKGSIDFHISPNYYAYLELKDKIYSIHYRYSESGWY